jgi:hypothetical protein
MTAAGPVIPRRMERRSAVARGARARATSASISPRRAVDREGLARLSLADINRFRARRERFRGASFDTAYTAWLERADVVLAGADGGTHGPGHSLSRLRIETLPFDYTQFGSLPGVA